VNLHNCPTVSPAEVAHARRYRTKTTRMEQQPFLYVEFVAHADVEVTGNHRNGFILRMIVSGDFVFVCADVPAKLTLAQLLQQRLRLF
jgi:hypothetical protein